MRWLEIVDRQCEYYYFGSGYRQCECSTEHLHRVITMQIGTGQFSARVVAHGAWMGTMRLNQVDTSGQQAERWHTRATLTRDGDLLARIHYQNSKECTIRSQSSKSCSSKNKGRVKVSKKRTRVGTKQINLKQKRVKVGTERSKIIQKRINNADEKQRKFGTENFRWSRRRDRNCNEEM